MLSCRVADEDVEPAQFAHRVGNQLLTEILVADVARQRYGFASRLTNQRKHFVGIRFLLRQIANRDVGAFSREGDCGRAADAGITAGDQRFPSDEPLRAAVAGLPVVRSRIHFIGEARPRLLLIGEGRLRIFRQRID